MQGSGPARDLVMTMAWGWVVKMLATRSQGTGLFGYLASMDRNKTRVRLEKARQEATKEIIDHLAGGGVYREGTPEGWREIMIPQALQSPIFVAPIEQPDSPSKRSESATSAPTLDGGPHQPR
jgi:hypothetical protein